MTKIAALQMNSQANVTTNLTAASNLIEKAALEGNRLLVLPEMFAVMGTDQMDKVEQAELYGKGPIQDFLKEQAIKHKVWIVGGTIPIITDDKTRIRAACLVINDIGDVVMRYDKMHLFDINLEDEGAVYNESHSTEAGDTLGLVDTPFGTLGVAVCYDLRFPELFRILFQEGAEIIAVPSAFIDATGRAHWEALLRARAIENFSYIIGANQHGLHNERRKSYGHSMIVNPWGEIVAMRESGDAVVSSEIDLAYLTKIRASIPVMQHQRIRVQHS